MKNKLLRTMIAIGIFAFSMNLNAFNMNEPGGGGCNSSGVTYVCGELQVAQLERDATRNCCAGSSIQWYDVCTNRGDTLEITENGSNSSCAD
ncbi:hypothetical protein OB69_16165 [Roseivirga seohaensis subsp. aquiponti]|uniref:Kazal-like domain-containing protein n=1 Tax=Roseivirga seohaensis subsp. aquiponti TaxID=1566026 RepID=A0A0L8AHI2_9BACT|nr:hypothetical protein [Roseivirga seohaensis]KOF01864.1 hypothetical protein OB69_16165 [Roseivirga seohaensis subsp. aquiponti]